MLARALAAFLILPGVVGFALPLILAWADPWRSSAAPAWALGAGGALWLLGLVVLLWCVRDFYVAGKGTLAPWDPPKRLVVVGLFRVMRNPMYVGVLALVAGWAVVLASPLTAAYTAAVALGFHLRVVLHEEPWLEATFGAEWRAYRLRAHRWLPRRPIPPTEPGPVKGP